MIHGWRGLWPYAQTWWGWTVAVVTILAAIYQGPKAVWETYEWYMDRFFDCKVREFLESNVNKGVARGGQQQVWGIPKSATEIAIATKMSEKRVLGCLRRLKKKKAVSPDGDRWKIA
jgi:hypothetical protein